MCRIFESLFENKMKLRQQGSIIPHPYISTNNLEENLYVERWLCAFRKDWICVQLMSYACTSLN